VAAGGMVDGRGVAAALVLGAGGAVLGTRFVATEESEAKEGFKRLVVSQGDGGVETVRTRIFDELRGTGPWPAEYGGRAVANESWKEYEQGVDMRVLEDRYKKAEEDDDWGRLTAFTGTGTGLVKEILPAGEVVEGVRREAVEVLRRRAKELERL